MSIHFIVILSWLKVLLAIKNIVHNAQYSDFNSMLRIKRAREKNIIFLAHTWDLRLNLAVSLHQVISRYSYTLNDNMLKCLPLYQTRNGPLFSFCVCTFCEMKISWWIQKNQKRKKKLHEHTYGIRNYLLHKMYSHFLRLKYSVQVYQV